MSAVQRKAAFALLMACYHNSFAEADATGRVDHSPEFIRKLSEMVVDAATAQQAAQVLQLDPRLTATEAGIVAIAIAQAIAEDESLAQHFIDLELMGEGIAANFDENVDVDAVTRALSEIGDMAILARPGDLIADGVQADMLLVTIDPTDEVVESIVTAARARAVQEQDQVAEAAAAAAAPAVSKYSDRHECTALDLDPVTYCDAALAGCTLSRAQVEALFGEAFGTKACEIALKGVMKGEAEAIVSEAPTDDQSIRNRMLRILAARGFVRAEADATKNPLADVGFKVVNALVSEGETACWRGEGKLRIALTTDAFAGAIDDLAVAIDEACDTEEAIFGLAVERIIDLGMLPMTLARKTAMIEHAQRKSSDPAAQAAARAKALRAVAKATLLACGAVRDPALAESLAIWAAYKPVAVVTDTVIDPSVAALDALLGA